MAEFKDLPENTSPDGADIIAVAQDSDDVTVKVQLDNLPIVTELASTANGDGASKVAIEDSGANFTSTDVEGALAELHAMMDGLDSWVSGTTYTAPNDVVLLASNNKIYRCITTNSDVTFTPAKWQAVGKDSYTIGDDSATGSNVTLTAPTTDLVRLTSGTLVSVDMIPAGEIGNPIWLLNRTGVAITISDETGATAAQRIKTGTGADLTLEDDATIQMIYDTTESRWQVVGGKGSGGSTVQIAYINEESNSQANSTSNTVHTRTLNSPYGDVSIIVSLAASQFTLGEGTYYLEYFGCAYQSNYNSIFIYNVTDAAYLSTTQVSEFNWSSDAQSRPTFGNDTLTIASNKTFELRHWINNGVVGGLGNSGYATATNPASTNVHAQVKITKIG